MKKMSLFLVLTMLLACLFGTGMAEDPAVTATFGTPVLDGDASDADWAKATPVNFGDSNASAEAKMLWDDNALYVLMVVDDANLDVSSATNYQQDGIELFVDELNNKSTSYASDDVHYRVNYENERSTDAGEIPRWYSKTSVRYDEDGNAIGYIVEACFQWNEATPDNDAVLGFDLQINACSGGSRQSAPCIFDTTGNAYQNTSLFGEITLTGKAADAKTPAYPYGLMYYIEEVEGRNLGVFVNPEIVDQPLADGKAIAGNVNATQEEIDAAYAAIENALKGLDDGSGMTNAEALPTIEGMPDLMKFQDGTDVVTAEDWEKRREELLDLYSYYMYGYMPDASQETVTYTITDPVGGQDGKELNITVEVDGKTASFSVLFTLPDPETNPAPEGGYPYFVEYSGYKMNFWGMEWWTGPSSNQTFAAERGYAGVAYDPGSVAADSDARTGAFYTLYPYGEDYKSQNGTLIAWAWGVGKIIDALEAGAAEELNINPENSLVGGVSRYGKGAAVAGVYEPRIKVVIPSCSGAGGLAIYRTNNSGKTYDLTSLGGSDAWTNESANEPLSNLQGGEAYWFCGNWTKVPGVEEIPVDQHMLAALVADPDRHMIIVTGIESEGWNNTEGQALAYIASQEAWDLLGVSDQNNMIIHLNGHAILTSDMQYILDYCDVHLYGKDPSEVESDLSQMKGNLFLEENREILDPYFAPYLNPLVSLEAAETVEFGQYVDVEVETSIPVKNDIAEGTINLLVQFIDNATNEVVGEELYPVPAMKAKEFKTNVSIWAYAEGVDPAAADQYTMYVTAMGGSEDEGIVTTDQVIDVAISPLSEIFYIVNQDSDMVERADMVVFSVTLVGQHLMTEDITLTFVGDKNGAAIESAVFPFTMDGDTTLHYAASLPVDTEIGDVLTYVCDAIGETVAFTVYTIDMETQAPELNAREFGGSGIASVTGSSTVIGKVHVTRGQYLALRSEPVISSDTFMTWLPRDTEVLIYGTTDDGVWAYVSTPDMVTRGWVAMQYIRELPERLEVGDTWEDAPHYSGMGTVTEYVHLYTEPSIWAATMHIVPEGENVSIIMTVMGDSDYTQWVLIQTESGLVGYIPVDNVDQSLVAGVTVYSFHAGSTAYVDASYLTIRTEPFGDPCGNLPRGVEVTVVQDLGNGWAQITSAYGDGYVSTMYLDSEKAYEEGNVSLEVEGEVQAGYFAAGETAVVNASTLNYRTGPGYSFDVLGKLNSGETVTVVSDNGYGWVLIENPADGAQVWVSRSYLVKVEAPAEPTEPVE